MGTVGERLQIMRVAAGLNQSQVAVAINLDASAVSRIEKGKRQISGYELGLLTEEFGWDVRDVLGIERRHPKVEVAARLRRPGDSSASAREKVAALVEADEILDDVDTVNAARGLQFERLLPAPVTAADATRQGSDVAASVRAEFDFTGPIRDLIGFAENELGVDVMIAELDDGCDGIVAIADGVAVVAIATDVVSGYQRFTLAHELGHAIMGDVTDSVLVDIERDELIEQRANSFAAALLMPPGETARMLGSAVTYASAATAMIDLGVSWSALKRRAVELGVTVPADVAGLTGEHVFTAAGRGSEAALVAQPIPVRVPSRMDRRAKSAYASASIGTGLLSMALGVARTDRVTAGLGDRGDI